MILQVFALYDRIAKVYGRFYITHSVGTGIRSFTDDLNDPQSPLYKHPDDYDLYHLGSYDDSIGRVEHIEHNKCVAAGSEVKIRDAASSVTQLPLGIHQ